MKSIHALVFFLFPAFVGPTNEFTRDFLGFSIYISNTTERKDGMLCFKENNFTASNIPEVFNITCPYHGQYVIYYNERLRDVHYPKDYSAFAYNDLCEFEVYGTYGHSIFVFSRLKGQERFPDRNSFEVFHHGHCYRCRYISFNIFNEPI